MESTQTAVGTGLDARLRNHSCDVGHEVAPGGIEYQAIDRFAKRPRGKKGCNDNGGSEEGDGRADTLCDRDGEQLVRCERHGSMIDQNTTDISDPERREKKEKM